MGFLLRVCQTPDLVSGSYRKSLPLRRKECVKVIFIDYLGSFEMDVDIITSLIPSTISMVYKIYVEVATGHGSSIW